MRLIDIGEVFVSRIATGERFELMNLYKSEWINCIYLHLKDNEVVNASSNEVFNLISPVSKIK